MSEHVELYRYDISNPIVRTVASGLNFTKGLSGNIAGLFPTNVEKYGKWRTALVVFDLEYSYGEKGIIITEPDVSCKPTIKDYLGSTDVSQDSFEKYVRNLRVSTFKSTDYNVTSNNCDHFSNKLCQYLLNCDIPDRLHAE